MELVLGFHPCRQHIIHNLMVLSVTDHRFEEVDESPGVVHSPLDGYVVLNGGLGVCFYVIRDNLHKVSYDVL